MAIETECLTPDTDYHISICDDSVMIHIELPFPFNLSEEEAALLETLLHNQVELVLAPYFLGHMEHYPVAIPNHK